MPILKVLTENIALLRDIAFLLAIAINVMVLISFKMVDGKSVNESNFIIFFIKNF